MALKERVHSVETEYAVSYVADRGRKPNAGSIVDALKRALSESHGLPSTEYIVNGSKLYHDVGHAEWAQPECRNARNLAAYDKAADHLFIHTVVPRADAMFAREGGEGRLIVAKNNTDSYGNTYGCHENYQMQRDADLLHSRDFLRYVAQCLIPFLVSRQLLAGSGYLKVERGRGGQQVAYHLSQRSAFIETVVSHDTTKSRPIFNTGRERESFATGLHRRLHQVLGDANLSGWATYIKSGTTGLVLRLIEDIFIDHVPALHDPVAALHTINKDITSRATVLLQDGRKMTALDLQWLYYDLVDQYLNIFGAGDYDEQLMEDWGAALEDYEQDPMNLRDRADWAIKKHMLDTFLQAQGQTFTDEPVTDRAVLTELQGINLRYHELSPEGLYVRAYPVDTLVRHEEILYAQEYPPPYTRARIRGTVIRLGRECALKIHAGPWTEMSIEGQRISVESPLEFDHPELVRWDRPWERLAELLVEAPDDKRLHYKLGRSHFYADQYQKACAAFREAVGQDPINTSYIQALARTLAHMGQYDEALKWFEKQVQHTGRGFQSHQADYNGLGDVQRHMGRDDAALQTYREATENDHPGAARAYAAIAQVHLKRGEIQSAETYFRKAQQFPDSKLPALVGLGALLVGRGEREAGYDLLQQALQLSDVRIRQDMTLTAARYFQAVARIGLEQEDALAAFEAALSHQFPDAADGLYLLEPLLALLATADPPLRDLAAAQERAQGVAIQPLPEEPPTPPHIPTQVADWLRHASEYHNPEVRRQAALYMGWRLDVEHLAEVAMITQLLLARAQHDPDPRVRREALNALAHPALRDTPEMDAIIQCLHDADITVQWSAQASLERITLPGLPAAPNRTTVRATVSGSPAHSGETPQPRQAAPPPRRPSPFGRSRSRGSDQFDDDGVF